MRKLSESIWSDIQDRSSGETIRKEDDVNLLDKHQFIDYVKNHYESLYPEEHKITSTSIDLGVPVIYESGYSERVSYYFKQNSIVISHYRTPKSLVKALNDNFLLEDVDNRHIIYNICPKDGGEVNNSFFIEVIDFILDNIDESQRCIRKKINESIWSDLQDRSSGETVRKEDDVNHMNMNELYEHIYELYEQINPFPMPLKSLEDTSDKKIQYFSIPIFKVNYKVYRLDAIFKNDKISVLTLMATDVVIKDFKQALIDNFNVTIRSDTALTIEEKDGTLTNQTCMKLISVIVENAPEPYLKKREN